MEKIKFIQMTEEELQEKLTAVAEQTAVKVVEAMRSLDRLPKSEIMRRLNIKDNRTFNNKVRDYDVKPAGKIGKEPAYYLSSFQKAS